MSAKKTQSEINEENEQLGRKILYLLTSIRNYREEKIKDQYNEPALARVIGENARDLFEAVFFEEVTNDTSK